MTTTATQIILPGLVEPSGLVVEHAPVGDPGPDQLLVRVEATGVSFAEQSMRRGKYFGQPAFPFVPGYDLVGRVLAAGSGVDKGLVGTRVASMTKTGSWTTHALVSARDSVVVPESLDPVDVEALVVNGVTAWQMLYRSARVKPGQTILVHGASGAVGGLIAQLAQRDGIRIIGGASPRHHDGLRAAGIEPVDYSDPRFEQRVRDLAPNGVDAVFDNVGGEMSRTSWRLLAPGGTLVGYSIIAALQADRNLTLAFFTAIGRVLLWDVLPNGRHANFYDLWSGHSARPARFRRRLEADLASVLQLLADGELTPEIAARFPLEQASEALAFAEARTARGKVILLP